MEIKANDAFAIDHLCCELALYKYKQTWLDKMWMWQVCSQFTHCLTLRLCVTGLVTLNHKHTACGLTTSSQSDTTCRGVCCHCDWCNAMKDYTVELKHGQASFFFNKTESKTFSDIIFLIHLSEIPHAVFNFEPHPFPLISLYPIQKIEQLLYFLIYK